MKRQRGIAFTLVLILVAGGLAVAAVGTLMIQIRAGGKAAGIAQEQPKTKAAELKAANAETRASQLNSQLSDAVAINKTNLAEVDTLRARFAETKQTLDEIQALQNAQEVKTRAALTTFAEREKRQASEIRRLREIAASPSTITISDGGLSEADTILRTAIRDMLGLRQP